MAKKLSIGIVGLPNVGKSTLFNAITNSQVEAQNYPFCTIEPNFGVVAVPDERLSVLAGISGTKTIIPATIDFFDIAGLVKGASKGEGLGNAFLANIRATSVIAHVVRCFDSDDIIHVFGEVDPIRDLEVINLELILSDLEYISKVMDTIRKKARSGDDYTKKRLGLLETLQQLLESEKPVRSYSFSSDELALVSDLDLLTIKKMIYIANVDESAINKPSKYVDALQEFAKSQGDDMIVVSAALECELSQLDEADKLEMLSEFGLKESGLNRLSKTSFDLLGLQTYLTTGVKETRAWTIHKGMTAPQAAGVIHTDFEKGFIRANIVAYDDFVSCNGLKGAREKGLLRQEGREYVMKDGDVVEFLFNV
jgi:GTP-binding protein YchF